jgi:hypothetical protein
MRLKVHGLLVAMVLALLAGCDSLINQSQKSDKAVTAFSFASPDAAGTIVESSHSIAVTVPYGTDLTALIPTIAHSGASVSPASGIAQDFSDAVTYTVTAADGSTQDYLVTINVAARATKAITAFSLAAPAATGSVSESSHSIAVAVPYGTDLTALVPTIAHSGASVSPASGVEQDFSAPVPYTVTAADGSTQAYIVTVAAAAYAEKAVTAFSFAVPAATGVISETTHAIAVTLPFGTDLTALVPTIAYAGAGLNPASGIAQDFSAPATYTVTAADGTAQPYTVTVSISASRTINHWNTDLSRIPASAIERARSSLHVAYGHTSHGSQLVDGMEGLDAFMGGTGLYTVSRSGEAGALDLRDGAFSGYGADDLGNPSFTAWAAATRAYLLANTDVNVAIWSWCGQTSWSTQGDIQTDMDLLSGLIVDFPSVSFVFMTGHLDGTGAQGNLNLRNQQVRDYCAARNFWLFDFADIESYDPDGVEYMTRYANDGCGYDSDGDGDADANWATAWQNAHPGEWYSCGSAHSEPLNANRKAYAAWYLWARLAGWGG